MTLITQGYLSNGRYHKRVMCLNSVGAVCTIGCLVPAAEYTTLLVGSSSSTVGNTVSTNVANVEPEDGWVNVAVTEDKEESKNGLGNNVEDAIEDGFRIGMNDITTLR